MAAVAALAPGDASSKDQSDFQQHSVGLGAGPEGLLGYAESQLRQGRGLQGKVFSVASKLPSLQPLDPAAHNTLGLALEARGDCARAAQAYRNALHLLCTMAPNAAAGVQQPPTTAPGVPLGAAVRLNLARALVLGECYDEAVDAYGELEVAAELDGQPEAWISYALARRHTGDARGAVDALQSALQDALDGEVAAEAARALVELHSAAGDVRAAVAALEEHVPRLQARRAPLGAVEGLWLSALAGAVCARDGAMASRIVSSARRWAIDADYGEPHFEAHLLALTGVAQLVSSNLEGAVRALGAAVHTCPWSPSLRTGHAAAAVRAGRAAAAQRVMSASPPPSSDQQATTNTTTFAVCLGGQGVANERLRAQSTALLSLCSSAMLPELREQLTRVTRAVHHTPADAELWSTAVQLATATAVASGQRGDFERALRWCAGAVGVAGQDAAGRRARLGMCAAESLLHLPGQLGAAAQAAAGAVATAEGCGMHILHAGALSQVARCHWASGAQDAAEHAYKMAWEAAPDAARMIELAGFYQGVGRAEHGAVLLGQKAAPGTSGVAIGLHRAVCLAAASQAEEAARVARLQAHAAPPFADGLASVAHVVLGAIALHGAQQHLGADPGSTLLLAEARRALARAHESAVTHAMLARVELLGNWRRKEERVAAHAEASARLCPRPVPATLFALLGATLKSSTLCAKAVHTNPAEPALWSQLHACATSLSAE